jgi:small conductance mechanosensitive channel
MTDLTTALQSAVSWLAANAVAVAIIFVLLFIAFRGARPLIRKLLVGVVRAQQSTVGDSEVYALEVERRVSTIEDLLNKVIRFGVTAGLIAVVLGVLNLWSVLASLGIIIAAMAFAGQAIILDYLMGIFILAEGQYFKGDVVLINTVEGTVEEVGIRKTMIRDARGTLHVISNGLIRQSANRTRTYAQATVDIDGVAGHDVERVIEILDEVGASLVADPELGPALQDTPGYVTTVRLTSNGATLRFGGRVQPERRQRVEAEARRRIAGAMAERGIELIRTPELGAPR